MTEGKGFKIGSINMIDLLFCHLLGDYVLQIDYIAKTKSENTYHLLVHCVLYCLPFYLLLGDVWQVWFIFITHIVIDLLKAKYKKISYTTDQLLHYVVLVLIWVL